MGLTDVKLNLWNDGDCESPLDLGFNCTIWQHVSFNNRHDSYQDPYKFVQSTGPHGPEPYINIRRKLAGKTAFWLDFFDHSSVVWSLHGEGPKCQWDTSTFCGLLLGNYRELRRFSHKEREESARRAMTDLTSWCNGEVYGYHFTDMEGQPLVLSDLCSERLKQHRDTFGVGRNSGFTSIGGFFDAAHMFEDIRATIKDEQYEVKAVEGEAAWLEEIHKVTPQAVWGENGEAAKLLGFMASR